MRDRHPDIVLVVLAVSFVGVEIQGQLSEVRAALMLCGPYNPGPNCWKTHVSGLFLQPRCGEPLYID